MKSRISKKNDVNIAFGKSRISKKMMLTLLSKRWSHRDFKENSVAENLERYLTEILIFSIEILMFLVLLQP